MKRTFNHPRRLCCLVSLISLVLLLKYLVIMASEQNVVLSLRSDFKLFMLDWCRVRQHRTNLQTVLGPCQNKISWRSEKLGVPTSAKLSFISSWQLKPAGQFSRFILQTVSRSGNVKNTGGDWWRIIIKGNASAMKPAVFDLGNGSYEVLFLVGEPGVYNIHIVLDYTTCDGFRDPPHDWFIIGNSQGKMQPLGALQGRVKDFLLEPFQTRKRITINIRLPNARGLNIFNGLPYEVLKNTRDCLRCGLRCNLVWDGYGRWIQEQWKPFVTVRQRHTYRGGVKGNTLWIYGDSQARRMFNEVINMPLCQSLFKSCQLTMNWVYPYSGESPPQDDLDFNVTKITSHLKQVLELPEMSRNSVMVLNLGLHYAHSTNFSNYVQLLQAVVSLFKDHKSVRMIWKTSTPVSKEKDLKEFVHADRKRFLNNARTAMYNAFSSALMCREGFEVLDIHPLTSTYPYGTGGPNVEFYKEHDIVHFKPHVMAPFEQTLTEYLKGNLPTTISLQHFKFS